MLKFILLAVAFFAAVSCSDDAEPTEEDLEALYALLPPSEDSAPNFSEILAKMSQDEKDKLKQWLTQVSQESARVNMEFGEYDLQVLRKLVEKKVPGYETFLDEKGEPTEAGRLRLYKALGYRRVSK